MSKLIGTDPNQVPSNADLGSAAFMDKKEFLLAKGSSLSAIDAIIPKTATDIFIYDTRKDSDGGAWRKRTQYTSWYNERLNTTTRGNRKEFPAVAVIVAESTKVTIFDGDDPSLPMWMEFNTSGTTGWYLPSLLCAGNVSVTSISALNGAIISGSYTYGYRYLNFISERSEFRELGYYRVIDRPIVDRNANVSWQPLPDLGSNGHLINDSINDLAMRVLPNAPVDPATGLPTPTIAIATEGGMNFIRDDGRVWNLASTNATYSRVKFVEFLDDNSIIATARTYDGSGYYFILRHSIPDTDDTYNFSTTGAASQNYSDDRAPYIYPASSSSGYENSIAVSKTGQFATGINQADRVLSIVDPMPEDRKAYGMVAGVTDEWNTGWMNGDIQLATLSDTDRNNVVSPELITNGTFDTDTSGWTAMTGASISHSSGQMTVTSSGSAIWNGAYQGLTGLTVGKTYILTADIVTSNNWGSINFTNGAGSAVKYGSYTSWNGGSSFPLKAYAQFTATATSVVVAIDSLNTTSATVTTVDNISVRLAEEDRSVHDHSLQAFGTLIKTPVASGADLMSYSGFGSSNYLRRKNDTFDFSNPGTICFMGWQKLSDVSNYSYVASVYDTNNTKQLGLATNSSSAGSPGTAYLYDSTNSQLNSTSRVDDGNWHFIVGVMDKYHKRIYVDGVLENKTNITTISLNSVNVMNVGHYTSNGTDLNYHNLGELALVRISATAPTDEQVAKIYRDEKVLFQDNAKCTLYGTTSAVNALTYDDGTDLLHVGTSSGRSVFQGLRRIDNTTRAVTTAISAVNGFVVEE